MRLWDVEAGRCLRVLKGHTSGVSTVTWTVAQQRALSGAQDETVRLWEVDTGRCLRVFEGHTGYISCVACSADEEKSGLGKGISVVPATRCFPIGRHELLKELRQ